MAAEKMGVVEDSSRVKDSTEKLDQIIVKINLNILSLIKNWYLLAITYEWELWNQQIHLRCQELLFTTN